MALPGPTQKPLLKFPPFPAVPEETTILPFASFKERGIQVAPNHSGEEVDGLGIPTVELRVPHDTDECKTGATKRSGIKNVKKDNEEVVPVTDPNPNPKRTYYHYERRDWWEEWAVAEESRGSSNAYNPCVLFSPKIHIAQLRAHTIKGTYREWTGSTKPPLIFERAALGRMSSPKFPIYGTKCVLSFCRSLIHATHTHLPRYGCTSAS